MHVTGDGTALWSSEVMWDLETTGAKRSKSRADALSEGPGVWRSAGSPGADRLKLVLGVTGSARVLWTDCSLLLEAPPSSGAAGQVRLGASQLCLDG